MGFVIDSDVAINAERQRKKLSDLIIQDPTAEYFISVITVSELFHGYERATNEKVRDERKQFIESILNHFRVISIDAETAKIHAKIWAGLQERHEMIGVHDSWIAASCLYYGHTLITLNLRDFERIPGLRLA
jgi:tRNA(fMet)-specific endonuclease VapC